MSHSQNVKLNEFTVDLKKKQELLKSMIQNNILAIENYKKEQQEIEDIFDLLQSTGAIV